MKNFLIAAVVCIFSIGSAQAATYTDTYNEFSNANGPSAVFTRNIAVANTTSSDGTFQLKARGDFDLSQEYVSVSVEGNFLGTFFASGGNQYGPVLTSPEITIAQSLLSSIISDGIFSVQYTLGPWVNNLGSGEFLTSSISFDENLSPVPVPAAAWLFGSALLGFVGFKRKAAKKAA